MPQERRRRSRSAGSLPSRLRSFSKSSEVIIVGENPDKPLAISIVLPAATAARAEVVDTDADGVSSFARAWNERAREAALALDREATRREKVTFFFFFFFAP